MPEKPDDTGNVSTSDPNAKAPAAENAVSVDKAEYDAMKADQARIAKLDELASDADVGSAEEYVEFVEDAYYKLKDSQGKPAEKTPDEKKPDGQGDPPPQPAGLDDEAQKKLDASQQASYQALLESQFAAFQMTRFNRKEDESSDYDRKQLTKVIQSDRHLVAETAKKFDGNAYLAAEYILDLRQGIEDAQKKGAASAEALKKAGDSGKVPTDGPTGEPANQTLTDQVAKHNKAYADMIAPATPYEYEEKK